MEPLFSSKISMKALMVLMLVQFIHGDYNQDICPEGEEGCTDDNICGTCNSDWGNYQTEGCLYCNAQDILLERKGWCPWRCVKCQDGYELVTKEFENYDIPDIWCEYTGATPPTTTASEQCTVTAVWSWSRSYSSTVDQYWWIDDPAATFSGMKRCPEPERTELESEFSLVFSSVDIGINGGGWDCEDDNCDEISSFGGLSAHKNRYSTSTDTGSIALDVVQFTDAGIANIQGNDVEVRANSLKFGINMTEVFTPVKVCIDGWASTWRYDQDDYTLCGEDEGYQYTYYNGNAGVIVVDDASCLSGQLSKDKTIQVSITDDAKSVKLGEYQIYNDDTATCDGYDDIDVAVSAVSKQILVIDERGESRAFATVEMCYSFPECASGNIEYDPFVYYEGDDADSGFEVVSINCSILTMIATTFIILYHAAF